MKFTIKVRLFLGFGILTLILIGLGIYSILSLGTVNKQVIIEATDIIPSVNYANQINTGTSDYRMTEYQYIITTYTD